MPYDLAKALSNVTEKPKNFTLYCDTSGKKAEVVIGSSLPSKDLQDQVEKKVGNKKRVISGIVFFDKVEMHLVFSTKDDPSDVNRGRISTAMRLSKCHRLFDLRKPLPTEPESVNGDASEDGEVSSDHAQKRESSESETSSGEEKVRLQPNPNVVQKPMMAQSRQARPNVQQVPTTANNTNQPPRPVPTTANNTNQPLRPAPTTANNTNQPLRPVPTTANNTNQPPRPVPTTANNTNQPPRPAPTTANNTNQPPKLTNPFPKGSVPNPTPFNLRPTGRDVSLKSGKGLPQDQQPVVEDPAQANQAQPRRRPVQGAPRQPRPKLNDSGVNKVQERTNDILDSLKAKAFEVARVSFPKGSSDATITELTASPLTVDREHLRSLTVSPVMENIYEEYIASADNDRQRKEWPVKIKNEKDAAAAVHQAMEDLDANPHSDTHRDKLATECQNAVKIYERRFLQKTKEFDGNIALESDAKVKKVREANREIFLAGPEGDRLAASYDALLEARLQKSGILLHDLEKALRAVETRKTEDAVSEVHALATQYRKMLGEHSDNYKKLPGRNQPKAVVDRLAYVDNLLDQADKTLFSLKQAQLEQATPDAEKPRATRALADKARQIKASELLGTGTRAKGEGGGSDVFVIREPQKEGLFGKKKSKGKVAFAFKSAKGENPEMKMPPGSGAIREVVTSKVMDTVLEQTGFDFGFPKVTMATLDGHVGALIEGINGTILQPDNIPEKEKAKIAAFQNGIPGKQLQKSFCAAILTGNILDQKWDNVCIEGEGAEAIARPFDAGAGFLSTKEMKYQLSGRLGQGLNVPLLNDVNGKVVDGAQEPMADEVMQAMLKIDLADLTQSIDDEVQRQAIYGLDRHLDVESQENGLKCLKIAKEILQGHADQGSHPTLSAFVQEFGNRIMAEFADPNG
ncbi:MAG TPA: hypothetical protein VGM54_00225 [Chthoniobacter sp.]|jgi:hypothetical protein